MTVSNRNHIVLIPQLVDGYSRSFRAIIEEWVAAYLRLVGGIARHATAEIGPKNRTPSQAGQGSFGFRPNHKTLALELFVELASGARDVHPARHAAFPILNTLHNAGRLGALGTIRALGGIYFLFTVARFRNLCHGLSNLLQLGDPRRRVLLSLDLAPFALADLKKTNPQQQEMSRKFGPDTSPDTSQSGSESLAIQVYTKPRIVTTSSATL